MEGTGGYYGCINAGKGACDNKLIVRRTLTERVILTAVGEKLANAENLAYLLQRVEEKVKEMHSEVPETIRLKEVQLIAEQRQVDNFVSYIAQGRSSDAVGRALETAESRAKELAADLITLNASKERVFQAPPIEWIAERVASIQEVLEQRVEKSALILRKLLGKIRLEPVNPDIGKPYLRASTSLQALALFEIKPGSEKSEPGYSTEPDDGSNSLRWWRRRESNPRPKMLPRGRLRAYPVEFVSPRGASTGRGSTRLALVFFARKPRAGRRASPR